MMEMRAAERSKAPLHNFDMPWLRWGSRRVMRCMKVDDNANGGRELQAPSPPTTSFDHRRSISIGRSRDSVLQRRGSTAFFKTRDGGIDAVREELMLDLQTAADKMKDAFLREGLVESPASGSASCGGAAAEMEGLRPWNLRIRRAACKEPGNGGGGGSGGGVRIRAEAAKSQRLSRAVGGGGAAAAMAASGEKRERAKFSVALARQEIEDDFMIMTAHRLPRRPKKRPKIIQKNLDAIFPGSWLTEISADFYKVADAPETNGKR